MIFGDPKWFYWPVTFLTAATFVAAHLALVARRHGRASGTPVLSVLAVVSIAIPVVPLLIGVYATCNSDTGHVPHHSGLAIVLGVGGAGVGGHRWTPLYCGWAYLCARNARRDHRVPMRPCERIPRVRCFHRRPRAVLQRQPRSTSWPFPRRDRCPGRLCRRRLMASRANELTSSRPIRYAAMWGPRFGTHDGCGATTRRLTPPARLEYGPTTARRERLARSLTVHRVFTGPRIASRIEYRGCYYSYGHPHRKCVHGREGTRRLPTDSIRLRRDSPQERLNLPKKTDPLRSAWGTYSKRSCSGP